MESTVEVKVFAHQTHSSSVGSSILMRVHGTRAQGQNASRSLLQTNRSLSHGYRDSCIVIFAKLNDRCASEKTVRNRSGEKYIGGLIVGENCMKNQTRVVAQHREGVDVHATRLVSVALGSKILVA
jgi:hypothetical protein